MGYGFITLQNDANVDESIALIQGFKLDGRRLSVQPCRGRTKQANGEPIVGVKERKLRGPPSSTLVYVGNLPYSMTSEDLSIMMSEYNVKGCHIVSRHNGSSKGFGFVEAANHSEQLRILSEMKDCKCDDRVINVRAASSEPPYGTLNFSGKIK